MGRRVIVDQAHTTRGDVRRRRIDGRRHRLGRQRALGEATGERRGEAVAGAARVAPLGRCRHHQRGALALYEERASGAECDGDTACPPATCEQLRLLGHAAHVAGERQPGECRRLGLVGGHQADAGDRWRTARMRIPDDLAAGPPLERGADAGVCRHPAAVVGDEHDLRLVERAGAPSSRATDLTARRPRGRHAATCARHSGCGPSPPSGRRMPRLTTSTRSSSRRASSSTPAASSGTAVTSVTVRPARAASVAARAAPPGRVRVTGSDTTGAGASGQRRSTSPSMSRSSSASPMTTNGVMSTNPTRSGSARQRRSPHTAGGSRPGAPPGWSRCAWPRRR